MKTVAGESLLKLLSAFKGNTTEIEQYILSIDEQNLKVLCKTTTNQEKHMDDKTDLSQGNDVQGIVKWFKFFSSKIYHDNRGKKSPCNLITMLRLEK